MGTWTTAPAPAESAAFSNHTLRMNVGASLGGDTLRVRLSNAHGSRKLVVGDAFWNWRLTSLRIWSICYISGQEL